MKAGMKRNMENVEPKALKKKSAIEGRFNSHAFEATNNDLETKNTENFEKIKCLQEQIKYQPSGAGGTRSLSATPHCL